jgi:hypothetical protein
MLFVIILSSVLNRFCRQSVIFRTGGYIIIVNDLLLHYYRGNYGILGYRLCDFEGLTIFLTAFSSNPARGI